ncbi:hypothetical protein ACFSVJ_16615 [Prauserella oleivorans]
MQLPLDLVEHRGRRAQQPAPDVDVLHLEAVGRAGRAQAAELGPPPGLDDLRAQLHSALLSGALLGE